MSNQVEMSHSNADEIDLKEIVRSVIETKNWVIVSILAMTIFYWGFQSIKGALLTPIYTYEIRVSFLFKGVDKGNYPNESPFNLSDLVSPIVVSKVYDSSGLAEYVTLKQFQSGLSVRPYTLDRGMLLSKYSEQLGSDSMSVAEAEQLQERIRSELDQASRGAAVVSLSGAFLHGVPEDLVESAVVKIPQTWAKHMTEQIGVGDISETIYTSGVLDDSILADMDYLIAFELLLDRLDLLQHNVDTIREIPNGTVIRDDVSGYTLPDLEKAIADIKRYRVAPLVNPVRSLGIAKNPELVQLYFENELIELGRELQLLETKKSNISEAYNSYLHTKVGPTTGGRESSQVVTIEPQIFDKLVELTNSGADIGYRQELNKNFLEAADKISEVESEIERINQILESMKGKNSSTQALRESYSSQVNEQLPEIVSMLLDCFDASERLYKKLSRENLGMGADMFRYADGDTEKAVSRTILSFSNVRLFFILSFLVVVLVVPLSMVVKAIKK